MEYGLFDFTDEYYRSIDAINVSSLKELRKSPKHYWLALNKPQVRVPAFDFGNAFHWSILEPKKFNSDVVVKPKFSGTGSRAEGKRWEEDHKGKVIITAGEHSNIKAMAEVVKNHPRFKELMSMEHKIEQTLLWRDPITQQNCKAKLDLIVRNPDGTYTAVDLKSTLDACYSAFKQSVAAYGYFVQAAYYYDGLTRTSGPVKHFEFLAVEKANPHGVGSYVCSEQMIEFGRNIYNSLLKKVLTIKRTKEYSDYESREMFVSGYTVAKWASDCGLNHD